MAAPEYVPVPPTERPRVPWVSPPHVPQAWTLSERPAEVAEGRQPQGPRLGYPGPDIGYALTLAELLRPKIRVTSGISVDDAVMGCVGVAMRRAATFGRAPVMHDLRLAFTIWGFLDEVPPADLVDFRKSLFQAAAHDYETARAIVDRIPEATLRLSPQQVASLYPAEWRQLVGA
jgi:hypothetical protein